MTKEEILSYVMESPENTNYSVLKNMLNRLDISDGLPDVTSEDNGKVLTVVSGDWEAVKTEWYGPYYFTNENPYYTLSDDTTFDVRLNIISDRDGGYYELPSHPLQTPPEIKVVDVNFEQTDGDGSIINGVGIPYMYYSESDVPEEEGWYWDSTFATAHLLKIKDPMSGITTIPAEGIIVGFLINVELDELANA